MYTATIFFSQYGYFSTHFKLQFLQVMLRKKDTFNLNYFQTHFMVLVLGYDAYSIRISVADVKNVRLTCYKRQHMNGFRCMD
jgi:hypothetical protein